MKRFITIALLTLVAVVSCKKFDDSKIWDKLNEHETRIVYLEELCKRMNTDIVNLQTIITALETNDYIVNASPLATGDGYALIFKSGKSVVIYNGKDGKDGEDGEDGEDGKDGTNGVTPVISVMKDTDGHYYWTVNGEWLIVDGEKVKASATDGRNGENGTNGVDGTDGVTPKFKIEEGYWYISYDNGVSWEMLGKATGDDGLVGEDGDSFFKSISIDDGFVVFILNDGNDTIIKIPLQKDAMLVVQLEEAGTLQSIIISEERRVTTKLKILGPINNLDMLFIQHFLSLVELDLSEAIFNEDEINEDNNTFYLNPYREEIANTTLFKVWLPQTSASVKVCYSYCVNLEHIIVPSQDTYKWRCDDEIDLSFCPMLQTLEYSEGFINIPSDVKMNYYYYASHYYYNDKSKYKHVILPSTTESVSGTFLRYDHIIKSKVTYEMSDMVVTCKAVSPPSVEMHRSDIPDTYTYKYINCTLYVPSTSVDAYKEHDVWGQFNVLPIEE